MSAATLGSFGGLVIVVISASWLFLIRHPTQRMNRRSAEVDPQVLELVTKVATGFAAFGVVVGTIITVASAIAWIV